MSDRVKPSLNNKKDQLLAASSLIPLMGALAQDCNCRALNYTVFVILFLFHKIRHVELVDNRTKSLLSVNLEFILLFCMSGLLVNSLGLLGSDKIDLLPFNWLQFSTPLILYLTMAVSWLLVFRFFSFTVRSAFLLSAALAVFLDIPLLITVDDKVIDNEVCIIA